MIITNFSNYSEFKIDESSLKQCIRKHFYKIKRPVYIEVDKKLERAYGMQTVLYLKDYENHSQHWTPNFIKEVESKDNYFHRIKLSYEYLDVAFHNQAKSKRQTKKWGLNEHYDFKRGQYPFVYLFHVLSHELQHSQQIEEASGKSFPYVVLSNLFFQYKSPNWKEYHYLHDQGCKVEMEFDAELAALKKGPKMLRTYYGV